MRGAIREGGVGWGDAFVFEGGGDGGGPVRCGKCGVRGQVN